MRPYRPFGPQTERYWALEKQEPIVEEPGQLEICRRPCEVALQSSLRRMGLRKPQMDLEPQPWESQKDSLS